MKLPKLIFTSLALVAAVSSPAFAQEKPIKLQNTVMHEKSIVDESGKAEVKLVKPEMIVPGDRIIFGTSYQNTGAEIVTNFVVTNPISPKVKLASDAKADLTVSVDGGKSWGSLAKLTVTENDGSKRPAAHEDVTHVRWTLATVEPGEDGQLEFPAIIR